MAVSLTLHQKIFCFILLQTEMRLIKSISRYKFGICSLSVNLKTGLLRIGPEEKDVVQNVALAFVASTLYLLVQPRPQDPKVVAQATIKRGPKKVRAQSLRLVFFSVNLQ